MCATFADQMRRTGGIMPIDGADTKSGLDHGDSGGKLGVKRHLGADAGAACHETGIRTRRGDGDSGVTSQLGQQVRAADTDDSAGEGSAGVDSTARCACAAPGGGHSSGVAGP